MRDGKIFASLSAGLLARKGEARPAMRPQRCATDLDGARIDDLGWDDMGDDLPAEAPLVVRQQAEIAREFAAPVAETPAGRKSAFTLRLDADRHLRLRLVCAARHRSAQQIVVQALDELLARMPEAGRLAASLSEPDDAADAGRTPEGYRSMTDKTLGRAALVSLALGTATIGCTPSARMDHVSALSDTAVKGGAVASRAAKKARIALARHDAPAAIRWAERAVAASPNDADDRMLLGQAYLAAGRFASAEASLRDTLALLPDQPRASFDLALAQIAQGMSGDALVTLASVKGRVPDADLGLAMALAGDRANGIAVLTGIVRDGKSDARARQNLALVFALDDQWGQARGMAMQDTAPDRLESKLSDWSAMAKRHAGAEQIASLLGIAPALSDPGRPPALALAAPTVQAPVALALAAPMSIAAAPPQSLPAASPVRVVSLSLDAPVTAAGDARPAPAVVPAMLVSPSMPIVTAAAPALVRVAAIVPSRATVAPGPLLHAPAASGFVVQLGAFARPGAIDAAWTRAARLVPRFANFSTLRGSTQHLGGTLVRLSIGGFGSRRDAIDACAEIRTRGGACFVRSELGDQPWQWARTDIPTQIAMR